MNQAPDEQGNAAATVDPAMQQRTGKLLSCWRRLQRHRFLIFHLLSQDAVCVSGKQTGGCKKKEGCWRDIERGEHGIEL